MRSILVTGANGFIGSNLCKMLKEYYTVDQITRQNCDLTNKQQVHNFFQNKYYDFVIHGAIQGGDRLSDDTARVFYNNTSMICNLIAQSQHFHTFVNIGTGMQYQSYPQMKYYAASKNVISTLIEKCSSYLNLVIFHCFGYGELSSKFMSICINRLSRNQELSIFNNRLYDFFSINDFLLVVKYLLDNDINNKRIDICYNEKYTLLDIANMISDIIKSTTKINVISQSNIPYVGKFDDCLLDVKLLGLEKSLQLMIRGNFR